MGDTVLQRNKQPELASFTTSSGALLRVLEQTLLVISLSQTLSKIALKYTVSQALYTTKAAREVFFHPDLCTDFIMLTNQK